MRLKLKEQGFSLIEMMCVVAIIGVLSTLAVPNYNLMVARARQAEAKGYLAGIYSAENAFRTEWGYFTVCLFQCGFIPDEGDRRFYATGFWGAGSDSLMAGVGSCMYSGGIAWGGYARDDATFMQNQWANPALTHGGPAGDFPAHTTSFKAVAFGSIHSSPNWDVWSIDERKAIVNEQSGL